MNFTNLIEVCKTKSGVTDSVQFTIECFLDLTDLT